MSFIFKYVAALIFSLLVFASGASAAPKAGDRIVEPVTNMSFVYIPAGKFLMGSPETEADRYADEQQHEVEIKKGFWMGQYEVTFDQYDAFTKEVGRDKARDLSNWGRGNRPVIYIKWFYAKAFADWLSKKSGHKYRLPTEAEWEYAARAGTTTAFSFGKHVGGMNNHSFFKKLLDSGKDSSAEDAERAMIDQHAWYGQNAGQKTHPVGEKKPNPWGLYDIHGNVWEWTCSLYSEDYSSSESCVENEKSNAKRSVRGGSWQFYAKGMRSADRRFFAPVMRLPYIGFRLVREN